MSYNKRVQKLDERPENFGKPAAIIEFYDVKKEEDGTELEHGGLGLHIKFYDAEGNLITKDNEDEPTDCHHLAMGAFKVVADLVAEVTGNTEEDLDLDDILSQVPAEERDAVDEMLREMGIPVPTDNKSKH